MAGDTFASQSLYHNWSGDACLALCDVLREQMSFAVAMSLVTGRAVIIACDCDVFSTLCVCRDRASVVVSEQLQVAQHTSRLHDVLVISIVRSSSSSKTILVNELIVLNRTVGRIVNTLLQHWKSELPRIQALGIS